MTQAAQPYISQSGAPTEVEPKLYSLFEGQQEDHIESLSTTYEGQQVVAMSVERISVWTVTYPDGHAPGEKKLSTE